MTARLCSATYDRPAGGSIFCTFIHGHHNDPDRTPHSWYWVQQEDERDAALDAEKCLANDDAPSDVQALLDAITAGNADPYLEAILAVTHNRKRALRGT
ncbi:hypothetical protein, partial [Bradyrhizobium sp. NBAIM08]|uniref:hypothetical protein n=1 Tax=Bradyrhizobium sp. NBAIM08 TaxID=2793815 RepID=UPI001CD3BBBE